jgi:hypothetical protein
MNSRQQKREVGLRRLTKAQSAKADFGAPRSARR